MKIEMKGYATRHSQKHGETEDGKQDYVFGRSMHLSGVLEKDGKKYYISEHGDISIPHIVKIENENRKSSKDAVYIPLCTIVSLVPLLSLAGEPRREKGFDLFEAEIEIQGSDQSKSV